EAQATLPRGTQFRRFICRCCVSNFGNLVRAVSFRVLSQCHQFARIPSRRFQRALPIVFRRGLFTEPCVTTRDIHTLHNLIEREMLALEQLLNLTPPVQRAESIKMLQKKIPRLERALERDGIELTLIFTFAIQ